MSASDLGRTIQLILAPAVMVSACAILVSGLLSRYAAINDRLRLLARERFDLLQSAQPIGGHTAVLDALGDERLQEIDEQIPELLHRHRMEHDAVLALYGAASLFVADMGILATTVALPNAGVIATAALVVFIVGIVVVFAGVVLAVLEVRISHRAVQREARRIGGLSVDR